MNKDKKKVFIKTFGCQMNVRDSEVVGGLLAKEGYKIIDSPVCSDIVIFNTCSVRQHAEDKVWSEVGRIAKKIKPHPIIGIIGCMAQNYKEAIFQRAPQVDFAVGPSDIHKLPEILAKVLKAKSRVAKYNMLEAKIWETDGLVRPEEIYHTGFYEDKRHAYAVISEGCSNNCSYCVVPYVRGELHHRAPKDILKEIKEAVQAGKTQVTLLGQNVNSYICQGTDFVALLKLVSNIEGLKEFSFVTSHPQDASGELFKATQELPNLKKYLHLPVQSGANRILKLMNRGYTREKYAELADQYRKIVTNGILTTDIIVGYPSETDDDFQDTFNLVKDIQFDAAFIFKYSPRPHTTAERMADDVPREVKERRHALILELQKKISQGKR